MKQAHQPLSLREKLGYALGDGASNFYWKVFEFFMMVFYTDVFGIEAGAAGWMLFWARLWDAFSDPVMGMIADRTSTKWGKFRPYLVWFAIPIGVAGVLMFTTPDLSDGGRLAYAYVTYIFMMTMYTAINIPYSALMGVMTSDTVERAQLSSFRFVGAFAAAMVVMGCTQWFVKTLGGGDEALGWQLTMAVYGVIAAVLFVACALTTKERVTPPARQDTNMRADLAALTRNGPWFVLFILGVLVIAGFALRGAAWAYYFKYFMVAEDDLSMYLLSGGFAAVVGAASMPTLNRFASKRKLYILCMGLSSVLAVPYYYLSPEDTTAIWTLNILTSFLLGPTAPLLFAMFTDTADYGRVAHGPPHHRFGHGRRHAQSQTRRGRRWRGFGVGALVARLRR